MGLLKIQNLVHEYRAIRVQLPKKTNGAQSSIKRSLYHQKILVVELNALLRVHEKTFTILDP
jgi:hypothetical protein